MFSYDHIKHDKFNNIMAWLPSKLTAQHKEIKRKFIKSRRSRLPDNDRIRRRVTSSEAKYVEYFVKGILDSNYAGRSRTSQTERLESLVGEMDNEAKKHVAVGKK